jgi:hypothetical protein
MMRLFLRERLLKPERNFPSWRKSLWRKHINRHP